MSFSLKVDTRGITLLKKKLDQMRTAEVEVGFFPESQYGPDNGNLHVAEVAWMQEKGAKDYPSRPFFTNTVEDRATIAMLAYRMRQGAIAALSPRGSIKAALMEAGESLAVDVRFAIDDYPGRNSDSWARRKGFNDPLRHTDLMIKSVKVKYND